MLDITTPWLTHFVTGNLYLLTTFTHFIHPLTLWLWQPPIFLLSLWACWVFFSLQISCTSTMQYLSFSVSLISLSIVLPRSIPVSQMAVFPYSLYVYEDIHIYMCVYTCMCVYVYRHTQTCIHADTHAHTPHFLYTFTRRWTPRFLHVLAVIAAENMGADTFSLMGSNKDWIGQSWWSRSPCCSQTTPIVPWQPLVRSPLRMVPTSQHGNAIMKCSHCTEGASLGPDFANRGMEAQSRKGTCSEQANLVN